jgi:hypothetical protein
MTKSFEKELLGYRVWLRSVRQTDHAYEEAFGKPRQELISCCLAGPVAIEKEGKQPDTRVHQKQGFLFREERSSHESGRRYAESVEPED